jgi:hypothetical protein
VAFVDHTTDAIHATLEAEFAQAMKQLQQIHFVNFAVDAGTVRSLKTMRCFFASPHSAIPPVLLSLQEKKFSVDD